MSDHNLLHRMSQGKTQNPRSLMTVYGVVVFEGVAKGVFKSGALHLTDVMYRMSIELTSITTSFLKAKYRARKKKDFQLKKK